MSRMFRKISVCLLPMIMFQELAIWTKEPINKAFYMKSYEFPKNLFFLLLLPLNVCEFNFFVM